MTNDAAGQRPEGEPGRTIDEAGADATVTARGSTAASLQSVDVPPPTDEALAMSPLIGLVVALLAGLLVWGTLEIVAPVFRLPEHLRELSGNVAEAEQQEFFAALKVNQEWNAVFALALLASVLAVALSVTELVYRRAGARIVWGGLLAGVIGGIAAIGAGAAGIALHEMVELEGNRLGKTLVVQAALLGVTGLGVGLAIAVPLCRPRLALTCLAGCLIGGLLAALAFPIAASVCLPDINTEELIPQPGIGRLLWAGLATGLIGLAATGLGKKRETKRAAAT